MSFPLQLARVGFIVCLIASASIGYLSVFAHSAVPGCSQGGSCQEVLAGSWAWMGPLPVAWAGALGYLAAVLAIGFLARRTTATMSALVTGIMAALLTSSAFFIVLQAAVIGHWCPWCCAIHAVSICACVLTLVALRKSNAADSLRQTAPFLKHPVCGGVLASGAALAIGYTLPVPAMPGAAPRIADTPAHLLPLSTSSSDATNREISLLEGQVHLDPRLLPILGNPSAKHFVIAITDPTCRHCRSQSRLLREVAASQDPEEVAILFLPGTRDPTFGPAMQQLLLTLWREKPEGWHEFHREWESADSQEPPDLSYERISEMAAHALGGREALDAALSKHKKWAGDQITATEKLIHANAKAQQAEPSLPQLMIGKKTILGAMTRASEVRNLMVSEFSFPRLAGENPVDDSNLRSAFTGGSKHSNFVTQLLVSTKDTAKQADASDPCESQFRSSCGRLIISLLGAGEISTNEHGWDSIGLQSANHLKQFSPTNPKILVQALAISSDPEFNAFGPKYFGRKKSIFLGTQPNSVESLAEEILVTSDESKIRQAIKTFEKDPECQKLKKARGLESVLPLIKVEILMDGEYTEFLDEPAFPSWSTRDGTGQVSKWRENRAFFKKSDWEKMMGLLEGAVIQTFIITCQGSKLAAFFEAGEDAEKTCNCFISGTAADQDDFTLNQARPTWNYAMPDRGLSNASPSTPNNWQGTGSITNMVPDVYVKNAGLVLYDSKSKEENPKKYVSIFSYERNPLMGFVYTSADALAAEALKKLPGGSDILAAHFISEMPALTPYKTDNARFTRLNEQINELELSYEPVYQESVKGLSSTDFDKHYAQFADCANGTSPPDAKTKNKIDCETLSEISSAIFANPKGPTENNYVRSKVKLGENVNKHVVRELWKSHIEKKASLSDVYIGLDAIWQSYENCRHSLTEVIINKPADDPKITPPVKAAANYMTENFEKAFDSVRPQLFNELRREAMQVKIARMRHAANLVAQNADTLPAGDADQFLKDLSSKLNCLTQFAVGPKWDANGPGKLPVPASRKAAAQAD